MIKLLLDVIPIREEDYRPIPEGIRDTVDTVAGFSQQVIDNVQSGGSSSGGKIAIIAAILAALAALAICIFFVAKQRQKAQMGQAVS